MTKEHWRTKRTLQYIGYKLGNNSFTWEYVERIGEILIEPETLRAKFSVYFVSGNDLEYSYPDYTLTPDYTEEKSFFGRKKVKITDVQYYFDRNCDVLQELRDTRNKVVKAYYKYKSGIQLLKGQKK